MHPRFALVGQARHPFGGEHSPQELPPPEAPVAFDALTLLDVMVLGHAPHPDGIERRKEADDHNKQNQENKRVIRRHGFATCLL